MQIHVLTSVLAALGGVNAQWLAPIPLSLNIPRPQPAPPAAPPPMAAPPVAPPPVAAPAIPASVVQSASSACAAMGQPTPYFDSNGQPVFCGPRIWQGGHIPAGTPLCP
ncbi:hypothetical protein PG999_005882 [Apiospora kogelbergensis]|uniref:Uncharacterized protein n=2 Tax=Apiospora kogelbergensis TaxID=1337665 RepID=A0AAW0QVR9_9PEZI